MTAAQSATAAEGAARDVADAAGLADKLARIPHPATDQTPCLSSDKAAAAGMIQLRRSYRITNLTDAEATTAVVRMRDRLTRTGWRISSQQGVGTPEATVNTVNDQAKIELSVVSGDNAILVFVQSSCVWPDGTPKPSS